MPLGAGDGTVGRLMRENERLRERVKELEEALTVAHTPCSCLAKVSAALRLPSSEPEP